MFQEPSRPAKRKLDFDSPKESEPELKTSWVFDGVDLDDRIAKLREELVRENAKDLPFAAPDPNSPLRTEYRKMQNAIHIANEATTHVEKKVEWMKYALSMSTQDEEQLNDRQQILNEFIKKLRKQIDTLNASISKNTQKAVQTVVEIYEEDFGNDDGDNQNYEKFINISKLCQVALDSFERVIKKTKVIENEVVKLRRNLKAIQKVCSSTKSHPAKYDKVIAHLSTNHNLAQLQAILSSLK